MGGNSVSSARTTRTPKPSKTPRQKKLENVLKEMKELSTSERRAALSTLRKGGLGELADALEALVPKPAGGSRPAERPSTNVPSSGKR
ncbi:MAG: hypothetical protein JNK82_36955 [Myxococcaceae bacterium]|nr:hypothetical protein [Myxococcaceae bacterium]